MNKNIVIIHHIDYDSLLSRFMGDTELLENMLLLFLQDDTFERIQDAYYKKDYLSLLEKTHTMKGVAGNLNMTWLLETSSTLHGYLRNNKNPEDDIVSSLFFELKDAYNEVREGIIGAME